MQMSDQLNEQSLKRSMGWKVGRRNAMDAEMPSSYGPARLTSSGLIVERTIIHAVNVIPQ